MAGLVPFGARLGILFRSTRGGQPGRFARPVGRSATYPINPCAQRWRRCRCPQLNRKEHRERRVKTGVRWSFISEVNAAVSVQEAHLRGLDYLLDLWQCGTTTVLILKRGGRGVRGGSDRLLRELRGAFPLKNQNHHDTHPIKNTLPALRALARAAGEKGNGGFDFQSAESINRAGAQGLPLSQIPQLPQSRHELRRNGATECGAVARRHAASRGTSRDSG